jgi:hypothetical protein
MMLLQLAGSDRKIWRKSQSMPPPASYFRHGLTLAIAVNLKVSDS